MHPYISRPISRPISHLCLLALCLGPILPTAAIAQTPPTPDPIPPRTVPETNPSVDPIERVVAAGLMTRDARGNFHAERALTRAQLATILVKTFDLGKRIPERPNATLPSDVPAGHWASDSIRTVLGTNTMRGDTATKFNPNRTMTRAEGFAIFAQAYGVFQYEADTVQNILNQYPDASSLPDWTRQAIATALNEGFVNLGANQRIRPSGTMTRGDIAYALSDYLSRKRPPAYVPQPSGEAAP